MSETHTSREHVTDVELAELQDMLARTTVRVAETVATLLSEEGYTAETPEGTDPHGVLAALAEVHPIETAQATLATLEAEAFLNALSEAFGL